MNKWDLYWATYEYLYNNEKQIVRRPVIILDQNEVVPIAMEVTKHPPRIDEPNQWDYPIEFWREAGLRLPSTAKVTEINYIRDRIPERWKIGHLDDFDIENIKIMMKSIPEDIKSPVHKEHSELDEEYSNILKEMGKIFIKRI